MSESSRRRFLSGSAIAVAAAALPASGRAFSLVEPSEDIRRKYESACGHQEYHNQLIAEVRDILEAKGEPREEEEVREIISSISCPLCGCPIDT